MRTGGVGHSAQHADGHIGAAAGVIGRDSIERPFVAALDIPGRRAAAGGDIQCDVVDGRVILQSEVQEAIGVQIGQKVGRPADERKRCKIENNYLAVGMIAPVVGEQSGLRGAAASQNAAPGP